MTFFVYVAGKYGDRGQITKRMRQVEELGGIISHDWTAIEQENKTREDMANYSKWDLEGIGRSQILIADLTNPSYPYRGTFTEIGYALGKNVEVWTICPSEDPNEIYAAGNIFFHHPDIIRHKNWESALTKLHQKIEVRKTNSIFVSQ